MNGLKRKLVELETQDGVVVRLHPVHSMTLALLQEKAKVKYPDPKAPRIPAPNAAEPGVTIADTENAEYKEALAHASKWRGLYFLALRNDAVIELVNTTKEELIEFYDFQLSRLQGLVEMFEDEPWLNALLHCVFAHTEDEREFNQVLNGQATLEEVTEEGIAEYIRLFRVVRPARKDSLRDGSSSLQKRASRKQ